MSRSLPLSPLMILTLAVGLGVVGSVAAQQKLLLQGKGRLALVATSGIVEWEMPWGGIHDLHVLPNRHLLVQRGSHQVVEIDPDTKQVVWEYDATKSTGNQDRKVEIHAFQPLKNGNLMVAESGSGRIVEVTREGKIVQELPLRVDHPHPHTDTRLARQLDNGNYLVCHEGDGVVREYDGQTKQVVWDYPVPLFGKQPAGGHGPEAFGNKCFAAVRLASGNTLIATGNGHSVLEVTPQRQIVRKIEQRALPGITLAWVTTLEVLPNGHWLIGNCHAGPGQPQVIEYAPEERRVVWKFSRFEDFGNDVSNSLAIEHVGASRR